MMTLKDVVQEVVTREGKKSNVAIGDVREIIRILCDIELETGGAVSEAIDEAVITVNEKIEAGLEAPDFDLDEEDDGDARND